MDLEQLKEKLNRMATELQNGDRKLLEGRLEGLTSVYPFSEYEYMLMFLKDREVITFEEYEKLRSNYIQENKYLGLYGISPRVFGQIWGEKHITDIDNRLKIANKSLDKVHEGQYDIWLEGIKLEVKACRAINTEKRGDIVTKALKYNSNQPFWMNYQQLKPDACDGFIFIGVWVNRIVYWMLTSEEAKRNKYISHQHRGGIEYQIGITNKNIKEFDIYAVTAQELVDKIIQKLKK
jgi:hypothetical protein